MTLLALAIVITSAFTHASWNYLAKRVNGGTSFTVLISALAALFYAPVMLYVVVTQRPTLGWAELGLLCGSIVFQYLYFNALNRAYSVGDMSLVYPIARGSGPMFSLIVAITVLGERPSWLAIGGAMLIGCGVLILTRAAARGSSSHANANRKAIGYALMVGLSIMSYTIWDKVSVSRYAIPPILVNWSVHFGLIWLFLPYTVRNWPTIKATWRQFKREAVVVALLYPLAYLLVLTAMVFTPVSYIAPAREISILVGSLMGMRLLGEGFTRMRMVGALVMTCGVLALALG